MKSSEPSPAAVSHSTNESKMVALAREIGADGITLWLEEDGYLVGVSNPLAPDALPHLRQPLTQGVVSQVRLTGQAILEHDLKSNPAHDSRIDSTLGTHCTTLMAAPVEFAAADGTESGGVLSAVIFANHPEPRSFTLAHLTALATLANDLEAPRKNTV